MVQIHSPRPLFLVASIATALSLRPFFGRFSVHSLQLRQLEPESAPLCHFMRKATSSLIFS